VVKDANLGGNADIMASLVKDADLGGNADLIASLAKDTDLGGAADLIASLVKDADLGGFPLGARRFSQVRAWGPGGGRELLSQWVRGGDHRAPNSQLHLGCWMRRPFLRDEGKGLLRQGRQ